MQAWFCRNVKLLLEGACGHWDMCKQHEAKRSAGPPATWPQAHGQMHMHLLKMSSPVEVLHTESFSPKPWAIVLYPYVWGSPVRLCSVPRRCLAAADAHIRLLYYNISALHDHTQGHCSCNTSARAQKLPPAQCM